MKIIATLASLAVSVLALSAVAGAGDKPRPDLCTLLSKAEVERIVGAPVHDGTALQLLTGCVWHTVADVGSGLMISRSAKGGWYPPTTWKGYKKVTGVGQQAFTNRNELGYEASARDAKGVTYVLISGKGSAAAALGALRLLMKR